MKRDPFRTLQVANPVTVEELREPLTSIATTDLYQQVTEAPRSRLPVPARHLRRRTPHRRRHLAATVVAAVTATIGWAWYQASQEPTKPSTVACYAAANLGSPAELVVNDGRPPVEICGDLWRGGLFGSVPVPPLVACVIPTGAIAVLPGRGAETCRVVGASNLEGATTTLSVSPSPSSRPASATTLDPATLTAALSSAIGPQACVDERQAREIVWRELAARGLAKWAIHVQSPFTPARPCATVGVDTPEQTVRLIPAPPRP